MINIEGTVKAVRKDNKGFKLDNDEWYSSYRALTESIVAGDFVSFTYKEKANPANPASPYKNIQGSVKVEGAGGVASSTTAYKGPASGAPVRLEFPLAPTCKERAISRRHAVSAAIEFLFQSNGDEITDIESVLHVAGMIDDWTTGQTILDEAEADASLLVGSEE